MQKKNLLTQFEHSAKIETKVESCNLKAILSSFLLSLAPIFGVLVSAVMLDYAVVYAEM